jgi:hypothetical protein
MLQFSSRKYIPNTKYSLVTLFEDLSKMGLYIAVRFCVGLEANKFSQQKGFLRNLTEDF